MRCYGYSEMLEDAINRQMDVYRLLDTDEESFADNDRSKFDPKRFPPRETEPVVRRRSRAQIQHLIELGEY